MEAIILAGGFGTRLRTVVQDVPKPMAPVCGKPFLEYILKYLKKNGVKRAILAVGYLHEVIEEYFKDSFDGIELVYSLEDYPLGTGGCIKKALSLAKEDDIYIINGDTFFDVDLKKMEGDIQIACKYLENFSRYGKILINEEGIIESFEEKKENQTGYINGGIYKFKKSIFDGYDLEEKFSLEIDFFQKYMNKLNIKAYLSNDYFIDIGIPEDYLKANEDFKNV